MTSNRFRPPLSITDHDRDSVGLRYVYPVLSRRAGGVSIGVNLNPNNACNWHCVYCQVPGLVRGGAPEIELDRLEAELEQLLREYVSPAEGEPVAVRDIAFSGNGEPTSAREFVPAVERVLAVRTRLGLDGVPLRLITNGSFMHRPGVREGVARIGAQGGEVWFKVDAARREDIARINGANLDPVRIARNLARCAALAPTWVQTCVFRMDGVGPDADAWGAYLDLLDSVGVGRLAGVLLYGIARPSMQPEASRLTPLEADAFSALAVVLEKKGLTVRVSP